jgi:hypothetical protein
MLSPYYDATLLLSGRIRLQCSAYTFAQQFRLDDSSNLV